MIRVISGWLICSCGMYENAGKKRNHLARRALAFGTSIDSLIDKTLRKREHGLPDFETKSPVSCGPARTRVQRVPSPM